MKKSFFLLYLIGQTMLLEAANFKITDMRVCGLDSPLGIDQAPTFSWRTESDERGFRQSAYAITVTTTDGTQVWSSGKVESAQQNRIAYAGTSLTSRTPYKWSVTVYDQDGNASEPAESSFETAFMSTSEWTAKWIQAPSQPNSKVEIEFDGGTNCRYIKLDATKLGLDASTDKGGYYLQLTEMEIYSNGENMASGASFSANENFVYGTIWSLNYINDGLINNGSCLGYTSDKHTSTNQHVYVIADLGSEMNVDRVVLYPRQDDCASDGTSAANFPASYTLQTSTDGSDYTVQYEAVDAAAPTYSKNSTNVPYFARRFTTNKEIARARLYASALGVFTMRLNGQPVTENKLEPGETEYGKSVLYSTYDVTDLLRNGNNTLLTQVAGGIFNVTSLTGRYSKPEITNAGAASLKAELWITYDDGTEEAILTDKDWRSTASPTTGSNWWGGEDYDARKRIDDIYSTDLYISDWQTVSEVQPTFSALGVTSDVGTLKARMYEPVRITETWEAVSVNSLSNGDYVVDFGRNFAGTYSFTLKGSEGQNIHLREAERLNADGSCYQDYYYSSNSVTYDDYTFAGDATGETWGPEFMYHGFRYLQISGLTEAPSPEDFTALRMRSNMDQTGSFETSNSLLSDIHTICRDGIQSQLYNSVTDCPQREKLGWLDVPNEMYNSLCFNYDMAQFWQKVVMDCFDAQYADGHVPSTVPHYMQVYDDDPNWGGAAILVPYRTLKTYGDPTLMQTYYPQMKQLIDYYTSRTSGYLMPGSSYSVLSDWGQNTCGLANETPGEFTITTTYYYLLKVMAEMATLLGYDADATTYTDLAAQVKIAFNNTFYGNRTAGIYNYGNQAELGMALYYGLVDEANESTVAEALAQKVISDNYRIRTGEIGLKPVLMSLARFGYNDIVYKMANQTDYPSYGYWVRQGCTTSPEYWDMSLSQNHCMMDHIEEWFFSELGGLHNTGTAWDEFEINPWQPSDMSSLAVSTRSPYGTISCEWRRYSSGGTIYTIDIPTNSVATVRLPLNGANAVMENGNALDINSDGVLDISFTNDSVSLRLGSGNYTLTLGNVEYDDPAANETFWIPVHSTDQLTEGSEVMIQETESCSHYATGWTAGRFIGYSQSLLPSEGQFATGAPFSLAATLTVSNPATYTVDNAQAFGCELLFGSFTLNSNADSGKMLSWNAESRTWGFDINDGNATFYRLNDNGKRNANYVFFYDNAIASGINAYGSNTTYSPVWTVYKHYEATDSAEVIIPSAICSKDSIIYERAFLRHGGYEGIILPFSLSEEEMPENYIFYEPVAVEYLESGATLYIKTATSVQAGSPYLAKYTGSASDISRTIQLKGLITDTSVYGGEICGTYGRLSQTDITQGKHLYILNDNGSGFVSASDNQAVSPFRIGIVSDKTPSTIAISEDVPTFIDSPKITAPTKATHGVFSLSGMKLENIESLPSGIYVIDGKKVAM